MKKIIPLFLAFLSFSYLFCVENDTDILKQEICNLHPSFLGWCSREKTLTLIDLVLEIKPKVCVDIGVFGGSSLFPVAATLKYLRSGSVFGIDPWDKLESLKSFHPVADEADFRWWANLDHNYVYDSYITSIKRFGLESYCVTMRTTSLKAASSFNQIDLLHIDGNHSEQGFTSDVQTYLPLVRPGGYILLNDSLWENAQNAVGLLIEECDVVKLIDSGNCIVFRKR
jgi:hypothetical protein